VVQEQSLGLVDFQLRIWRAWVAIPITEEIDDITGARPKTRSRLCSRSLILNWPPAVAPSLASQFVNRPPSAAEPSRPKGAVTLVRNARNLAVPNKWLDEGGMFDGPAMHAFRPHG